MVTSSFSSNFKTPEDLTSVNLSEFQAELMDESMGKDGSRKERRKYEGKNVRTE